jgi:hypothetical protein
MKKTIIALLLLSSTAVADSLRSINGVDCGQQVHEGVRVVPVGTNTYLYGINSVTFGENSVDVDLKLEFLQCARINNQYTWVNTRQLPSLYAYTQKIYNINNRWVNRGYWDTTQIRDTNEPLIYRVKFKPMRYNKLMNRTEFQAYQNGQTSVVHLKLDLSSERIPYTIPGFMILELRLSQNEKSFRLL